MQRQKAGTRRARSDARGQGPRTRRGIQIGPRIRIGGTLGKIGQKVKIGAGKVAKIAAPVASFVNPGLGAILGAAGTALDTSKGGVGLGQIAMSGAMNYGLGKAVGKIPGVGKLGSSIASKIPGGGRVADLLGKVGKMGGGLPGVGGAEGGGGGWMDKLGGFLGEHGDQLLTAGALASSYGTEKANRELRERAMGYATGSYDQRAPLRAAGMAGALNPERPNLSGIFANPGNAYARPGTATRVPITDRLRTGSGGLMKRLASGGMT